jgi:hypothetical protein
MLAHGIGTPMDCINTARENSVTEASEKHLLLFIGYRLFAVCRGRLQIAKKE